MEKNGEILIVDDQPANVKFLEQLLQFSGFTNVKSTTDSRNVEKMIAESPPNVILLDLEMPHLSGFDILEHLKKTDPDKKTSVVVLTASMDKEYKHRALDLGAIDYLSKPLDGKEVILRLTNILDANILNRMLHQEKETLQYLVDLQTAEIRETQLEVIRRLGKAAEFKDNETGMHILRMSKVCEILARAAGLSETECNLILYASPMHDIGKIGIPDNILLKPGRLDDEERIIMNRHAEIGASIIGENNSALLKLARIIAATHHEKWDGTGYPKQLKGENIPIGGRIAAIADVFDALTSERPYKKAWPVEEAMQFIRENRGIHFDPAITDLFIENLPAILAIREEHPDESY